MESLTIFEAQTLWDMYRAGLWGNLGAVISAHTAYAQMHNLTTMIAGMFDEKKTRPKPPASFMENNPALAELLAMEPDKKQKKTFKIEGM